MLHEDAPLALFRREVGGSGTEFSFVIQADHVLMDEHFPDFPVAPGSQVLNFIWQEICPSSTAYERAGVDVIDARFQLPCQAGIRLTCSSSNIVLAGAMRRRVRVTGPDGRVHLQAILSAPDPSRGSPGLLPADRPGAVEVAS
ncbi:hypothetical protein AAC691_17050 [Nguyenibacter vanlangensis]|uniref:3-hydroxyacyl-[acyl-carrier-protein] dehydratase n=1 Tax=Nguyenibacter vanlangensis TaxID=1216886 RepID=A0ABZ3D2U4_9PROT